MTTWKDFTTRASKTRGWLLRDGEAIWHSWEPPIGAIVRIMVPPTSIAPTRERVNLSLSDEDVQFEAYFLKNGVVTFQEARIFTSSWVELWGEPPVWIHLIDSPPPGFVPPKTVEFLPKHYDRLKKYAIRKTSMAPLWGQPREYFASQAWELNSWGRENFEPGIKWQQSWVRRNLQCPFCDLSEWNLTYAMTLGKAEEWVYDRGGHHYALLCPRCELCVDVVPRKLIR